MTDTSDGGQLRIAIYGKGGIGKSTLSANLSAAFAAMGRKVLQIGCDPKHDSTRLLVRGKKLQTVLQFLENPSSQSGWFALRRNALDPARQARDAIAAGRGIPEGLTADQIVHEGFGGVRCVEAGGPVPGVGCAGRGILSTFELLDKLGIRMADFDVVVYDVLGDVVCGGFGVPLREHHANRVMLVTSEEFMPIYAANNILRGVASYQRKGSRLTGIFLNRRDNAASDAPLRRFCDAVHLPVIGELPRSATIRKAELLEQTVIEAFPQSVEARAFEALAKRLLADPRLHEAKALTDDALEAVVLGREQTAIASVPAAPRGDVSTRPARAGGEPLRIAIYGKGGIGKSTIAANLAASLARKGHRVLQIGCDPKHDSSRLLLGGKRVRAVLDPNEAGGLDGGLLQDVIHPSAHGVDCVEVGGPEPGVGCAGRGILSAFTQLQKLGLDESRYDVVLYDVLGDIVCGGFAIPLRKDYAHVVMLVTSEEFMPLYAANNILGGIANVSGTARRVFGLFHNARDNDASWAPVDAFANAVALPVVARMRRSTLVQDAEAACRPLACFAPESLEAQVFDKLAEALLASPDLHPPKSLVAEDLEQVVLRGEAPTRSAVTARKPSGECAAEPSGCFTKGLELKFTGVEAPVSDPFYYRKKPIRPPVMECAFDGALMIALKLRDAYVVVHAPASCAHMRRIEISGMSAQLFRKRKGFYPDPMVPNLVCTGMKEEDFIYGGTDTLVDTLQAVLANKPPVVFLVTSCTPAIIGDDYADAIERAQPVSPETRIIPLRSDGNLTGGALNGMLSALFDGHLTLGHDDGQRDACSVNLVMDWDYEDSRTVQELLERVGVRVNARFSDGLRDATTEELRKLPRAPLTLLCARNFLTDIIRKHLMDTSHGVVAREHFPRGFRETEIWLREIGAFFHIEDRVEAVLDQERRAYLEAMARYRPGLEGKRLVVFTRGQPIDDVVDAALDVGMRVPFIGVIATKQESLFRTRHESTVQVRFSVHPDERLRMIREFEADAVFTMVRNDLPPGVVYLDSVGAVHGGFGTCVRLAERWSALFRAPKVEAWRADFDRLCPVGPPAFLQGAPRGR